MKIERIEDKCDNCMRCVRDCMPSVWREVGGVATPVAPRLCILCSHCLAVCPKSAIIHDALDPGQLKEPDRELIDSGAYREIVLTRRSVRHYKKKPLEREKIEKIIDLARFSPTGANAQNVQYTIVTDDDILEEISSRTFNTVVRIHKILNTRAGKGIVGLMGKTERLRAVIGYLDALEYFIEQANNGRDYITHGAPALLLLHGPGNGARDNCLIAATNIVNYANSMGLGTCFVGFVTMAVRRNKKLRRLLKIKKGHRVFAGLVVGYPAISHTFTVSRKQAKITWMEKEPNNFG